jgi:hypothetical protein
MAKIMNFLTTIIRFYFILLAIPFISIAQNFILQTDQAGFRTVNNTNGIAIADFDQDSDLDVYIVGRYGYSPADMRTWNRLFSNNGNGTFSDVTIGSGLLVVENDTLYNTSGNGSKLGAFWGDYDNDGYPDLFVTNYGFNQLFHNDGDNTFSDVTEKAGVSGGADYQSTGAVWFDYDVDGDLDLYVCNWKNFDSNKDQKNWMYENLGEGIFEDVSLRSGLADSGKTYTTLAFDANNDGYLDLYLANDFGDNRFYENQTDKTFEDKTEEYNLTDSFHGMGLALGDIDLNGYFDIYLTNATEDQYEEEINALFLNTGEHFFQNNSLPAGVAYAGWGWGTEFFDMENDGDEDLFVVTGFFLPGDSNRLFENNSTEDSLIFADITETAGVADDEAAHGLAVFDYDDDGDMDIFVSNVDDNPYLYANQMEQGNWIDVWLEGSESNRSGFGSIVEIEIDGNHHRKYHHGVQFQAQNIQPLHFGLGNAGIVDNITIYWLNGHVDSFDSVLVNQSFKIIEGGELISAIDNSSGLNRGGYKTIQLIKNYPNPFNGATQITFTIPSAGEVEVMIYNVLGQLIKSNKMTYSSPGTKMIIWNADDESKNIVGSGIYFFQLKMNNAYSNIGKMILIK